MTNIDCKFEFLPTIVGSMPLKDASQACALVARYLKDIPAWPQLPKRSPRENMYVQYSEGFPGAKVEGSKVTVDRTKDLTGALEKFYTAYLANDFNKYAISADYAAGLHRFLKLDNLAAQAVKGQVTGPVSWGMIVTDETGKPIIYDDTFADVVPKFLRLKATWMEKVLQGLNKRTIVFLDEPSMTTFGSVGMQLTRQQVIGFFNETLAGISGIKGIHCCGNTDWSILLSTATDIISIDAYDNAASLAIYPEEVKKLYDRGGAVAWGIVPTNNHDIANESVASLKDRLEEAIMPFTRHGIPLEQILKQGLVMPACGLPSVTEPAAERALELLTGLSQAIRSKYL